MDTGQKLEQQTPYCRHCKPYVPPGRVELLAACHVDSSRTVQTIGAGHTVVGLGSVRAIPVHWYVSCNAGSADGIDNTKLACQTRGALSEVCCTFCPVLIIGTGHPPVGGRALWAILVH